MHSKGLQTYFNFTVLYKEILQVTYLRWDLITLLTAWKQRDALTAVQWSSV